MSSLKSRIQKLESKTKVSDEVHIISWAEPGELVKIGDWDRQSDESEESFVARVEKAARRTMRGLVFLWGEKGFLSEQPS